MSLVEKAFKELFPGRVLDKSCSIVYSGKFKSFNANVRHSSYRLDFNLSSDWKSVSDDIKIGLIQSLLVKVYKSSKSTSNIDLYNSFIRNLSRFVPKVHSDPILDDSFSRVNEKYFYSLLDKPNLKWGKFSTYKLGSYDYHSDTIIISSLFKMIRNEILDYIMYHELLHKKHKYYSKNGRSFHHTSKFRSDERKYENYSLVEKELSSICRRARLKKFFFG